jgi:ABC-type uncharacterized transport system ATPase subunit
MTINGIRLELKNVSILAGKNTSVHNISLKVDKGEIIGIVSKNKHEQITLLMSCLGNKKINAGRICLNSCDITKKTFTERMGQGLVYLLPIKVRVGMLEWRYGEWRKYLPGHWKKERKRWTFLPWAKSPQAERSIKEIRQQFRLYRDNMTLPQCVILYEPFCNLTPFAGMRLQQELLKLSESGCSILLIASETDNLYPLCRRIALLEKGELVSMVEGNQANMDSLKIMLAKKTEREETND